MATNIVDIDQVPADIDDLSVGIVKNPLFEPFTAQWAKKDLTIPAAVGKTKIVKVRKEVPKLDKEDKEVLDEKKQPIMVGKYFEEEVEEVVPGKKQFPLPAAVHIAKHLAEKIIRAEFRAHIASIVDTEAKRIESAKPIPDYKGKVWEKMKELVETDSDFFEEKGLGADGMKERFTR